MFIQQKPTKNKLIKKKNTIFNITDLIINKFNNNNYEYVFLTSIEDNHLLRNNLDYDFIAEKLSDFDITDIKFCRFYTNNNIKDNLLKYFGYNIVETDVDDIHKYAYELRFDKKFINKDRKAKIKKLS